VFNEQDNAVGVVRPVNAFTGWMKHFQFGFRTCREALTGMNLTQRNTALLDRVT
jgi:hypothetical protein